MSPRTLSLLIALVLLAVHNPGSRQASENRGTSFVCGQDQKLPIPIPVTWGNIVLAGDGRLYMPCPLGGGHREDHREVRERTVLMAGLGGASIGPDGLIVGSSRSTSQNPMFLEARWRAAQALARLPAVVGFMSLRSTVTTACSARILVFNEDGKMLRWQPGQLFFLARDSNTAVRKEAVYAIGAKLAASTDLPESLVTGVAEEIRSCVRTEQEPEIVGLWLDALGAVRYRTPDQIRDSEAFLVSHAGYLDRPNRPKVLGAAKGLESLLRQNPNQVILEATRVRLRQLSGYGARTLAGSLDDPDARIRRLALMALRSAGDFDIDTLRAAALDADWQVRRLVAMSLRLDDPAHSQLAAILAEDLAFQVRYELLSPHQRLALTTKVCAPIAKFFKDASPAVVMRAMDVLPDECKDAEDVIPALEAFAEKLSRGESHEAWHVPSRALAALARLDPEKAATLFSHAVVHPIWHVRAAAAATSVALKAEDTAVTLAGDVEPNVRTAALEALFRLKSTKLATQAIGSLRFMNDYQLLMTAAIRLKDVSEELRDEASDALVNALRRITEEQSDTSRDTRVAMIQRLGETLRPERSAMLFPYLVDLDDEVLGEARKALIRIVGSAPEMNPNRRYPFQPPEEALYALPKTAMIELQDGSLTLQLLPEVAPVTVARFAALVTQGFYQNRTFHRVVPNFVVQGGSPAANEYAGTSRFMRDEVGPQAAHIRGAVGISTRGRDTGDGQIFIDLVDLPRLDREYTVFAYVVQGMELVDRMLEGAKIVNITLR